jgi:hypothetical protein
LKASRRSTLAQLAVSQRGRNPWLWSHHGTETREQHGIDPVILVAHQLALVRALYPRRIRDAYLHAHINERRGRWLTVAAGWPPYTAKPRNHYVTLFQPFAP